MKERFKNHLTLEDAKEVLSEYPEKETFVRDMVSRMGDEYIRENAEEYYDVCCEMVS